MLFTSVTALALVSYVVAADAQSEAFSELANIPSDDASAQLAWISKFATMSGDAADLFSMVPDSDSFGFPTSLDSEQMSLLNAITAADSGRAAATGVPGILPASVTGNGSSLQSPGQNLTSLGSPRSQPGAGSSRNSSSGAGSGSSSRSGSGSGSSSASGIAGKETPMIIGAALAGLSVLLM